MGRLGTSDGLPQPCPATLDNLELVPKAYLVERICRLAPGKVAEACVALAHAIDC